MVATTQPLRLGALRQPTNRLSARLTARRASRVLSFKAEQHGVEPGLATKEVEPTVKIAFKFQHQARPPLHLKLREKHAALLFKFCCRRRRRNSLLRCRRFARCFLRLTCCDIHRFISI